MTCISIYGGPDLDCGEGAGKILWVDNMGAAEGTLEEFKVFFESERHKKVRDTEMRLGLRGKALGHRRLPSEQQNETVDNCRTLHPLYAKSCELLVSSLGVDCIKVVVLTVAAPYPIPFHGLIFALFLR